MKIDKLGSKAVEAYVQQTQAPGEKAASVAAKEIKKPQRDDVSISQAARDLQEAQKAVQAAPDVRQDKVAAIKKRIQEGTYHVPTEALVDKLMSVVKDR